MKAVLTQEAEWYDAQNIEELPSKISAELKDIELGSGKSLGFIIFSVSMMISAYASALFMAGTLTLSTAAILPLFLVVGSIYGIIIMKDSEKTEIRYQKSGAHAEQALGAIKVVKAFGQENFEVTSYNQELDKYSSGANYQACLVGFAYGLLEILVYALTTFSLFVGTMFVKDHVSIHKLSYIFIGLQ